MNDPSGQRKRLVLMISGLTDLLMGAALLGIGLGWVPVDLKSYGVGNVYVSLLGAILFIVGAGIFIYHLSRLHE